MSANALKPRSDESAPIVFWGATGQAKVLAECLGNAYSLVALFDNNPELTTPFAAVPLIGGEGEFNAWWTEQPKHTPMYFAVAIGGNHGGVRLKRHQWLIQQGLQPATLIHPTAYVSPSAIVGQGCQILPKAVVHAHSQLGPQCIINTGAIVEHDNDLSEGVHIGPGAVLAGEVTVEANVFVGSNATILPRLTLGQSATIGAGTVVTRSVPPLATVAGNPAQILSVPVKV